MEQNQFGQATDNNDMWEWGGRERGGVCAEHDVMQEGSREQT